jgi:gluconolactonase
MRDMRFWLLISLGAALSWTQPLDQYQVEKVATGYRFTEGPAWSREGYMVFSDLPSQRIYKWTPGSPPEILRESSGRGNGNAFDSAGRLYTCEAGARRVVRADKQGRIEVLADNFEGRKLNSPNDLVLRHDAQVFFTDPAYGSADDTRELDFYGVYRISARNKVEAVARWKTRPNGIALSPDQKTLYVANSDERTITAWDLDRGGVATNERVVVRGIDGAPDGIKVDGKGNLWVACRVVAMYTPRGVRARIFEVGETPANLAFDAEFTSLYVTARTSIYRIGPVAKGAASH